MPGWSRSVVVAVTLSLLNGCSQYTRDLFWDNKIQPTPYAQPEDTIDLAEWQAHRVVYSWLGHATVLIKMDDLMMITDPVIHERIGPPEMFDNLFGIRRLVRLPIQIDQLAAVDLALVSHAHFDHLDLASLSTLAENESLFIMPYRNSEILDDDFDSIELDWLSRAASTHKVSGVTITAFRTEHYGYIDWGDRSEKRGFNGYLVRSDITGTSIAFFGDTSYLRYRDNSGSMLTVAESANWREKFPTAVLEEGIDLCIIPIGDYYYYWNHISPKDAVRLADELNCSKLLPVHYSTFLLTPLEVDVREPRKELQRVLSEQDRYDLVDCIRPDASQSFPGIGVSCVME